jgi:hypothetical protein
MHFDLPERRMQFGNSFDAHFRHFFLILPNLQRNNSTSSQSSITSLMIDDVGIFHKKKIPITNN